MKVGDRKKMNYSELSNGDIGISMKKAIKLIEKSPYYDEIYELLKIAEIENDFIPIEGANSLVDTIINIDNSFEKFDVQTELKNVRCNGLLDTKSAVLEISNIADEGILKKTRTDLIKGITKYSVKSDYLDLYQADKFLNYCLKNEYDDIIKLNLESLDNKNLSNEYQKQFRFLKDNNNDYFIRAITSVDRYKDYNIRFSVFIALVSLYGLIKSKKEEYVVSYYTCSESDVKVVFRRTYFRTIAKGLDIGFELELVNDEIKREAVKFNGLFSINYDNDSVLSIKPNLKANIISFSHRIGMKKVSLLLQGLSDAIDEFIEMVYQDAKYIKQSKSPKELKNYLYQKVLHAQQKDFREKYRKEVQKVIEKENVSTIYQLLDLMNKIDLMIDDSDIKAKDYWKNKLYDVLINSKKFDS
ncbi:MAG: hypothetical protein HRT67_01940 [Flavobacteriaceae bacterium]|nr:hypothetical protein [Flavobacteriaceae bacterium]